MIDTELSFFSVTRFKVYSKLLSYLIFSGYKKDLIKLEIANEPCYAQDHSVVLIFSVYKRL